MSNGKIAVIPFEGQLSNEHKRVDPCFMTGKGCVYTEVITDTTRLRKRQNEPSYVGFAAMPFRPNLQIFYNNCLERYFNSHFGGRVTLHRADEVRRPGLVICEGICKRIQEADFVTADISVHNPNVFYELGLAYGMGHNIVVLHNGPNDIANRLADLGCKSFQYHDLDPISVSEFNKSEYIWRLSEEERAAVGKPENILLYEHSFDDGVPETIPPPTLNDDIDLSFSAHVKSAVGIAVTDFSGPYFGAAPAIGQHSVVNVYKKIISGFSIVVDTKTDRNFKEIREQVNAAYCLIIRTGFRKCHPMAYFWLGYAHALGKNVVPVTVTFKHDEEIKDLAFDIRAQRHMIFMRDAPKRFEEELTASLHHMFVSDFSVWSRKRFWDRVLGRRGEVSIFTGALHNNSYGREMIGDWDLRAAAELTSYFARAQYRAKIENPVYTPEYPGADADRSYRTSLQSMMTDKNCILIASPDVNPLTEMVLGRIYGVEDSELFQLKNKDTLKGVVALKVRPIDSEKKAGRTGLTHDDATSDVDSPKRYFYREKPGKKGEKPKRGFMSHLFPGGKYFKDCDAFPEGELLLDYVSQTDQEKRRFDLMGHLVVAKNPFCAPNVEKFIIVLNGVSGPATFALTHALTGGVTKEFVAYSDPELPPKWSEQLLEQLMDKVDKQDKNSDWSLEMFIRVSIGESQTAGGGDVVADSSGVRAMEHTTSSFATDWRKIVSWELVALQPKSIIDSVYVRTH